jgi:hypothetical protein
MPSPDGVVEAVRVAMTSLRRDDLIDGVKKAISDELVRLDPSLKIAHTRFFNHTYNPDLVATWTDGGEKRERRIFLRGSLGAVVDSDDVTALSDQEPVLIGLVNEKKKTLNRLRTQLPVTTRSLATEVGSVARITGSSATRGTRRESQLGDLVRANLVRGGRGLLTNTDADRIVSVEGDEPAASLRAFQRTVRHLFVGSTAERLNRTAGLLSTLFDGTPDARTLEQLRNEPLTDGELAVVLPFLLERASNVQSPAVWAAIGSMLTLEKLEGMAGSLKDLDLTPVVKVAAREMQASRAAVFINPEEISDAEKDAKEPSWRMRGGRLSADVRRWALWVVSDSRKIRGREDGPDARWSDLASPLAEFDLTSVQLHGLSRKLSVANDDPATVLQDVASIRASIEDDFHVPSVTVREKDVPDAPSVDVEFGATTTTGRASLWFHVRAAGLLARSRPIANDDLELLVGP